jgi:hypothetical protein
VRAVSPFCSRNSLGRISWIYWPQTVSKSSTEAPTASSRTSNRHPAPEVDALLSDNPDTSATRLWEAEVQPGASPSMVEALAEQRRDGSRELSTRATKSPGPAVPPWYSSHMDFAKSERDLILCSLYALTHPANGDPTKVDVTLEHQCESLVKRFGGNPAAVHYAAPPSELAECFNLRDLLWFGFVAVGGLVVVIAPRLVGSCRRSRRTRLHDRIECCGRRATRYRHD